MVAATADRNTAALLDDLRNSPLAAGDDSLWARCSWARS